MYSELPILRALLALALFGLLYVTFRESFDPILQSIPISHHAPEKRLVLASYREQNITWTKDVEGWNIDQYFFDDMGSDLTVPRNQGREAMVYLTYITDHYENLPDYIAFTHGHEIGWHQAVPMPLLLQTINLKLVDEQGYAGMRCQARRGCTMGDFIDTHYVGDGKFKKVGILFRGFHEYLFRETDPWYRPVPDQVKATVGGQFVVSKKAIKSFPKAYWERMRRPLSRDLVETKTWFNGSIPSSWYMGMMFEKAWPYLFGAAAEECLDEEVCWATVFQGKLDCDDKNGHWEGRKFISQANCTVID